MPSYGFKVAKTGKVVGTANVQDLVLYSEANCIKIASIGSTSITAAAGAFTRGTVAHNLDFTPFFLTYYELTDSGRIYFQDSNDVSRHPNNFITGISEVRGTNELVVGISSDLGTAFTGTAHYILLGNKSY